MLPIEFEFEFEGPDSEEMPLRWCSSEVLRNRRFSVKSDVWAFGIFMWEVFAMGLQPYYGLSHTDVIKYVVEGQTLQKPYAASLPLYELMLACWKSQADARIDFDKLYNALQNL